MQLEGFSIDSFLERFGRPILLSGLSFFTLVAFFAGYLNILDYSVFIISIIGWVSLLFYIIINQFSKKSLEATSPFGKRYQWLTDISIFGIRYVKRLLDILFILGVIANLLIIHFCNPRPLGYFILIVALAMLVVLSALLSDIKNSQMNNLVKTLIIGFITTASIFKYYYYVGWDIWIHDVWNRLLVEVGSLSIVLGKEESTPLQHIMIAISDILLGVDTRLATILVCVIAGISLSVVVYCILNKYFRNNIAIIGIIIFTLSTQTIYWIVYGVTTSYAGLLFLPLILIMFKLAVETSLSAKSRLTLSALYLFLIFIITLTHMFSIFIIMFLIAAFYISSCLSQKRWNTTFLPLLFASYFIVFGYWLFATWGFGQFVSLISSSINSLITPSGIEGVDIPELYVNISAPDDWRLVLTQIWIPISFSVFIVSIWAFVKDKVKKKLWYITIPLFACLVFFAIIYISYPAMIMRIAAYISLFVALSFSHVIHSILRKSKKISIVQCVSIIILVTLICGISIIQNPIAPDKQFFYDETTIPTGYTINEIAGMETIVSKLPSETSIASDSPTQPVLLMVSTWETYLRSSVIPHLQQPFTQANWNNIQTIDSNGVLLFREKLLSSTTSIKIQYGDTGNDFVSQLIRLPENYTHQLDGTFNQVYDNSAIYLYRK